MNSSYSIRSLLCIVIIYTLFCSCDNKVLKPNPNTTLFTTIPAGDSKVTFRNTVKESLNFNFLNYLYMYNGGGVSIGDINNDGLDDLYFTANQGTNKMYLNKGKMIFEDITDKAGLADQEGWTTGTSMVDINNDGLLDIYVCKSGNASNPVLLRNKLFINQGNNTFKNLASEYGLDPMTFSTQSYFADFDKDGDLDMYLVNHRIDFQNTIVMSTEIQKNIVPEFSDRLFSNDGNRFTDITEISGITNKAWGLSASISDFNNDGWLDIYVCNDFLEPDILWINNKNGGFTNEVLDYMDHISYYSMGSDVADINNDGFHDLMVLDMVSEDHMRSKQNMPGMSSSQFNTMVNFGYHHQYMANMLQMNNGNSTFSEISHFAGVSKTDWSWGPLFADFDNDGLRDLFISNGIKRDMTDNDYKNKLGQRSAKGQMTLEEVYEIAPSTKLKNYIFKNSGDAVFENKVKEWGFDQNLNSNGAAYSDLDNDGDLDLVINNLEDFASIYENHSSNNYLKLKCKGPSNNAMGLGTKIEVKLADKTIHHQHFINRGFQSSVSPIINLGLGDEKSIESLTINWPDGKSQILKNVKANQFLEVNYANADQNTIANVEHTALVKQVNPSTFNVNYVHKENVYDDFSAEILLPYKHSTMGPKIATGDVNADGLADFYLSGTENMTGKLFIQTADNQFFESSPNLWLADKKYEDIGAHFFDSDGDGDLDLYVVSGGNEHSRSISMFQDRLYINNGEGTFTKSVNKLPKITSSGSIIISADYDKDGDMDLFVGGRIVPGKYPTPASSILLENKNGKFRNVTKTKAPELDKLGLVTDAVFSDYDQDGDSDLMIVGEWMPLTIFKNENGKFTKNEMSSVSGVGWWQHINAVDIDADGDYDYILGNLGLNNKFGAKEDKPFHVFCNDFDGSGNLDIVLSKESKGKLLPVRGRECSSQQMPFIKSKFPTFKSFAEADLQTIYGEEKLSGGLHYKATNFESGILINQNGTLEYHALPKKAQYGPTLSTICVDVNKDGHLDIIGGGNIYNTEVETVRFDGSKGYILLGDGTGMFIDLPYSGFDLDGNVKDICWIDMGVKKSIIVAKNGEPIQMFELL